MPAAAICSSTRSISPICAIPSFASTSKPRGEDPDALPGIDAVLINAAIADIPDDMTITCICAAATSSRNFSPPAGTSGFRNMFNRIEVDGYFMEYDSERAGGFEPLRLVPKDKKVVLGLVTSKSGGSSPRRDQAADRASHEIHRPRSALPLAATRLRLDGGRQRRGEDEQWAKLRMVVEIAEEVWG